MHKKLKKALSILMLSLLLLQLTACNIPNETIKTIDNFIAGLDTYIVEQPTEDAPTAAMPDGFDFSHVPSYTGSPYTIINDNVPFFTDTDYTTDSYESYAELDALNRCGTAMACIGTDLMPTEERGSIGSVKPSGWQTVKYPDQISDNYLYNRCHLIGYQLSGENANEKNLITGTRYLNISGMLDFENEVADYVRTTENHVLYRVTPIFIEDELVCRGILMEGYSIEDDGASIQFCVYCYNVQPEIGIDYATGDSWVESYLP